MIGHLRRLVCVTLLALLLAACAKPPASAPTINYATQFARDQAALATPIAGRISWRNEITSTALANNLIGDPATRSFDVYLPPGYDTGDTHYPVVYVLNGFGGGVDFSNLTRRFDGLIVAGEVHEMILVFFNGENRFGGSWYRSSATIGDYETFLSEELVSLVDSTYRTLPTRESRGMTGCSMGGYGSLHLALTHPDVFSVAAPMSGLEWAWDPSDYEFTLEPQDFHEFNSLPVATRALISIAAAAAPNPDQPPFYLDMPFRVVDGEMEVMPEVFQSINAMTLVNDLPTYLDQPIRLSGLMIFQDTDQGDPLVTTKGARAFDQRLTELGLQHEYLEVVAPHCGGDWAPILEFMSDHLAH